VEGATSTTQQTVMMTKARVDSADRLDGTSSSIAERSVGGHTARGQSVGLAVYSVTPGTAAAAASSKRLISASPRNVEDSF